MRHCRCSFSWKGAQYARYGAALCDRVLNYYKIYFSSVLLYFISQQNPIFFRINIAAWPVSFPQIDKPYFYFSIFCNQSIGIIKVDWFLMHQFLMA